MREEGQYESKPLITPPTVAPRATRGARYLNGLKIFFVLFFLSKYTTRRGSRHDLPVVSQKLNFLFFSTTAHAI